MSEAVKTAAPYGTADYQPEFEDGLVVLSWAEMGRMWYPNGVEIDGKWIGRRWMKRSKDGMLWWEFPDLDGGVVVPAFKDAAHPTRGGAGLYPNGAFEVIEVKSEEETPASDCPEAKSQIEAASEAELPEQTTAAAELQPA